MGIGLSHMGIWFLAKYPQQYKAVPTLLLRTVKGAFIGTN
jgi:hypothetical protein